MKQKNPGLALLDKKVDELGLQREVEEELAEVLIESKIARLRKRRGMTQADLARRSGVSQPMIAQIESGRLNNLTLKTLARTAYALDARLRVDLVSQSPSQRARRTRLARAAAKLDPKAEQAMANEGLESDLRTWPK